MPFSIFGRTSKTGEITAVSPKTEIQIPWLGWLSMMVLGPLFMTLCWCFFWGLWLYDAIQTKNMRWRYWFPRMWLPWWDNGGYVLFSLSLILAAVVATGITMYRFFTETGAKAWDARDGWYYPGKRVPPDERQVT